MKKTLLAFLFLVAGAAAGAGRQSAAAAAAPRFLLIDRQAILRFSKVGQDIARQIEALHQSGQGGDRRAAKVLAGRGPEAAAAGRHPGPDVKAQKVKAFEAKQAGIAGERPEEGAA